MMDARAETSESGPAWTGVLRTAAAVALIAATAGTPVLAQNAGDAPARFPDSPYLRIDPEKIVGAETCGECHAQEYQVWTQTLHSTQFNTMHRSEQAQGILDRMEFRLAKRESLCLRCHYTAEVDDGQAQALQGVSCESCHGAARDWIDIHNDYGGATHDTETEQNRQQRIERSIAAGMLRPSGDLYSVAANCFECHTVPAERLINEGGHPSGSDFELVAWSDSIRHNFLPAQWSDDQTNHAPTTERKRMMYIVGRILEYEYAIRGVAEATDRGSYSKAMERRAKVAYRNLQQLYGVAPVPEIAEILEIGGTLDLTPGNAEALLRGTDSFAEVVRRMEDRPMETDLSAVDDLIAGRTPEASALVAEPPSTGDAPAAETAPPDAPATAEAGADDTGGAAAPAGAPANTPTVTVGQVRSRPAWFPDGEYETTVPGCSCHTQANDWLLDDPHSGSLDLLSSARAAQIAEIYGIDPAAKDVGSNICASCHATVVSGDEAFAVFDPVSCESCHGPSSGYLDPHERGDGAGFEHGMRRLKDADVRASTCTNCHYITDERLVAAGHPTGEDKDLVSAMSSIRHWPDEKNVNRSGSYPEVSDAALSSAVQAIRASRTVPSVQVVEVQPATTKAPPAAASGGARAASGDGGAASSGGGRAATTGSFAAPQRARPVSTTPVSLDLEPIPAVSDSTSTEDILLIIKERLERIYRELGRGN